MKGRYLSVFIVLFNRFSRIFPRDAIKRLIIKFKRIIIKIKIIMILKLKSDRLLGHNFSSNAMLQIVYSPLLNVIYRPSSLQKNGD